MSDSGREFDEMYGHGERTRDPYAAVGNWLSNPRDSVRKDIHRKDRRHGTSPHSAEPDTFLVVSALHP